MKLFPIIATALLLSSPAFGQSILYGTSGKDAVELNCTSDNMILVADSTSAAGWNCVPISSLISPPNLDNDPLNETNQGVALNGTVLTIRDNGGDVDVDLSSLVSPPNLDNIADSFTSGDNSIVNNGTADALDLEVNISTSAGNTLTQGAGGALFAPDTDTDVSAALHEARCVATGREQRFGVVEDGVTLWTGWVPAPEVETELVVTAGTYAAPPVIAVPDGACRGDELTLRALGTQFEWAEATGTFFGSFRTVLAQQDAGGFANTFLLGGDVIEAEWNGARWIANWDPIEMSGPGWRLEEDGFATAWGTWAAQSSTASSIATLPLLATNTGYEVQITRFSNVPHGDDTLDGEKWVLTGARTVTGFDVPAYIPNLSTVTAGRWISHTIRPDFNAL